MGIFSKENCICCDKEIGMTKSKTLDGFICSSCMSKCDNNNFLHFNKMSLDEINESIANKYNNDKKLEEFKATKKIGTYLYADLEKKQFIIPGAFGSIKNCKLYNFEDVVEVEILEDGNPITKNSGIGKTLFWAILLGGIGALVSGVTGSKKTKTLVERLKVKITLNDISNPVKYINLITTKTKSDSFSYKISNDSAQEILSLLTVAKNNKENTEKTNLFCTSCGTKINENQLFCSKCGTKV